MNDFEKGVEMGHFQILNQDDPNSPSETLMSTTFTDFDMEIEKGQQAQEEIQKSQQLIVEQIRKLSDTNYGNSFKLIDLPYNLPSIILPKFPRCIASILCISISLGLRPFFFAITSCLDPHSY